MAPNVCLTLKELIVVELLWIRLVFIRADNICSVCLQVQKGKPLKVEPYSFKEVKGAETAHLMFPVVSALFISYSLGWGTS